MEGRTRIIPTICLTLLYSHKEQDWERVGLCIVDMLYANTKHFTRRIASQKYYSRYSISQHHPAKIPFTQNLKYLKITQLKLLN